MAAVFIDFFEATLAAAISDEDTDVSIDAADVQRVFDALGLSASYDAAEGLVYVPMWLDDGTHRESVRVIRAGRYSSTVVAVQRGAVPYAFGAGAKLRCSPTAYHASRGLDALHYVPTGNGLVAVETRDFINAASGEKMLWTPPEANSALTVRLPVSYWQAVAESLFTGDDLPMRIEIATLNIERTITFRYLDMIYEMPVSIVGATQTSITLAVPSSCRLAVLEIRRTPNELVSVGAARWQVKPEFYSA